MTSSCHAHTVLNSQKQSLSHLTVALVGNPNSGKTTVFNALTGASQKVGNWPGVTVERISGYINVAEKQIEVIDLPGIYSIMVPQQGALDEQIACDFILGKSADALINVVDASHLERHLYLTVQLLEQGYPVIVALNMMDVAEAHHIHIDINKLAHLLGCPVIPLKTHQGKAAALKQVLASVPLPTCRLNLPYPSAIKQAVRDLAETLTPYLTTNDAQAAEQLARRLLEEGITAETPAAVKQVANLQAEITQGLGEDADILMADTRYQWIRQLMKDCVQIAPSSTPTWSTRIDNIVLNRVLGIPIFLGMMYLMFVFAINVGGAFQDFFDLGSEAIFVQGLAQGLSHLGMPDWVIALLANGLGKGINTTLSFVPVIAALFLFLAFLEDSGYMARAAFVVDRFMQMLGLPGKAFIPMIVGLGCNVPAVMAARTLENQRDRILTIMMSPFMSCSARLAIFTVFAAAFFPHNGQNIIFALYMTGIVMAVLTGFILRHTCLKGEPAPLMMELPVYHLPHWSILLRHAWQRLKGFIFRAGRLIVPICLVIGSLNSIMIGHADQARSLLSILGQTAVPIFAPMGIHPDNWPAAVGLMTGILAKEVVVGTLNTLYSQIGHLAEAARGDAPWWMGLTAALHSIPANFAQLGDALSNPILAKAPVHELNKGVYGLMAQKFDGQIGAFAYLLFVLLYFPCVSTTAAMLREVHKGWAIFSILWMTVIAYGSAVIFYQAATWGRHPGTSLLWISALLGIFLSMVWLIRWQTSFSGKRMSAQQEKKKLFAGELL